MWDTPHYRSNRGPGIFHPLSDRYLGRDKILKLFLDGRNGGDLRGEWVGGACVVGKVWGLRCVGVVRRGACGKWECGTGQPRLAPGVCWRWGAVELFDGNWVVRRANNIRVYCLWGGGCPGE